jgi:hypothetical protein
MQYPGMDARCTAWQMICGCYLYFYFEADFLINFTLNIVVDAKNYIICVLFNRFMFFITHLWFFSEFKFKICNSFVVFLSLYSDRSITLYDLRMSSPTRKLIMQVLLAHYHELYLIDMVLRLFFFFLKL